MDSVPDIFPFLSGGSEKNSPSRARGGNVSEESAVTATTATADKNEEAKGESMFLQFCFHSFCHQAVSHGGEIHGKGIFYFSILYRLSLDCTFSLNCDFGKKAICQHFLSLSQFSRFFVCLSLTSASDHTSNYD
jgi:hypothetical protein